MRSASAHLARCRGDTGEIQARSRGDLGAAVRSDRWRAPGEMQGRSRGDLGEIWVPRCAVIGGARQYESKRSRGDLGEI